MEIRPILHPSSARYVTAMDLSPAGLFAGLLFGTLGFAGWRIGRKRQSGGKMLLGAALLLYPWFVEDPLWMWAGGIALTVLLFAVP